MAGKWTSIVREVGYLPRLAAFGVVRPDVEALVRSAIRKEVKRRLVPHRDLVIGRVVGDVLGRERVQIEEIEVGCHAASVSLPGAEGTAFRRVGDALSVRRDGPKLAVGHGQLLRQAALLRSAPELVEALPPALHRRSKKHALAVRVPVERALAVGVMAQAHRLAARGGHYVEIGVAVVVGAKGDLLTVRRETGKGLFPSGRGESVSRAPLLRHHPDVARVDERDVGLGDVRLPQHPRIDLGLDVGG